MIAATSTCLLPELSDCDEAPIADGDGDAVDNAAFGQDGNVSVESELAPWEDTEA